MTEKEQQKIIKDLKDGKIDMLIGTHRILSNDIKFHDLYSSVLSAAFRHPFLYTPTSIHHSLKYNPSYSPPIQLLFSH